jgi:hypothetical protein
MRKTTMTTPDERLRAIRNAREFLRSLVNPKETPRVPLEIRRRAYWALKHYPREYDIKFYEKAEKNSGYILDLDDRDK